MPFQPHHQLWIAGLLRFHWDGTIQQHLSIRIYASHLELPVQVRPYQEHPAVERGLEGHGLLYRSVADKLSSALLLRGRGVIVVFSAEEARARRATTVASNPPRVIQCIYFLILLFPFGFWISLPYLFRSPPV